MEVIDHNKEVDDEDNAKIDDVGSKKFVKRYRSTDILEYDICQACFNKQLNQLKESTGELRRVIDQKGTLAV